MAALVSVEGWIASATVLVDLLAHWTHAERCVAVLVSCRVGRRTDEACGFAICPALSLRRRSSPVKQSQVHSTARGVFFGSRSLGERSPIRQAWYRSSGIDPVEVE